jgi:hypothetical protein
METSSLSSDEAQGCGTSLESELLAHIIGDLQYSQMVKSHNLILTSYLFKLKKQSSPI